MMFAGDQTEEREAPHAPGVFFTFTNLGAEELAEAEREGTRRHAALAGPLTPERIAEAQKIIREQGAGLPNPLLDYDPVTLIRFGVTAWRGPGYDGRPCTTEEKAVLDPPSLMWAALTVLEIGGI